MLPNLQLVNTLRRAGLLCAALAYALLGFVAPHANAQQVEVRGRFSPSEIREGGSSRFEITVLGSQKTPRFAVPWPDGLDIQGEGRSQRTSITNFQRFIEVSYRFRVVPQRMGVFVIPSFTVDVGGVQHTVGPYTLRVAPASTGSSARSSNPNNPYSQRGSSVRSARSSAAQAQAQNPQLKLKLPRPFMYVGEAAKVSLQLRMPPGLRIENNSQPEKTGDAFLAPNYNGQYQRSRQIIAGQEFEVFAIPTVVTALKSGQHPLSFQMGLVVQNLNAAQAAPNLPTDPMRMGLEQFFQAVMGQMGAMGGARRQVALSTNNPPIEVRPLPTTGQPSSFAGAIGRFQLSQPKLSAHTAEAGEPITLTVDVTGTGNFTQMGPPVLQGVNSNEWLTYPPEVNFTAQDEFNYSGVTRVSFILRPQRTGMLETPSIAFSYFNPAAGTYQTLTQPSTTVNIRQNAAYQGALPPVINNASGAAPGGGLSKAAAETGAANPQAALQSALAGKHLAHPLRNWVFWLLLGLSIIFSGLMALHLRSSAWARRHPKAAKLQGILHTASAQLEAARTSHNAQAFFREGTACLQTLLAPHAQLKAAAEGGSMQTKAPKPSSLTALNLKALAQQSPAPENVNAQLTQFFEAASAARYSGQQRSSAPKPEHITLLEALTEDLAHALETALMAEVPEAEEIAAA